MRAALLPAYKKVSRAIGPTVASSITSTMNPDELETKAFIIKKKN